MRFPFKYFFHLIALTIMLMVISSCATNEPYVSESFEIDQDLNILSDAVTDRNVELLWNLKDSANERIAESAWRALAITTLELLQMNGVDMLEMDAILEDIDQNHPYLKNRALGLFKEQLAPEIYLTLIFDNLDSEGIEAQHATVALTEFATNYSNPSEVRDRIRTSLSNAILNQNRSVITALYTFDRGVVGMASSGQDTEGSQFFITHTWTPHLDGLYTIFGKVVQGMDVVDRIQIGDLVIKAEMVW